MSEFEVSVEEEVSDVKMRRPHVVVLGAGASRQTCPTGDKNGRSLPLMKDFVDVVNLRSLLVGWHVNPDENFEKIFSDFHKNGDTARITEIEQRVETYFKSLEIPDSPTVYDHLVLSLRGTDLIATFNWDPLLLQAYIRSRNAGLLLPQLAFLHGNVAVGYCPEHSIVGGADKECKTCGKKYQRTSLLYPVEQKDYAKDLFIANEWKQLKSGFKDAFMITIFGYSGPKTDEEAIEAMKEAWGSKDERAMEQIAFITNQLEEEVTEAWEPFVHTHHYEVDASFYDSWIAKHPRRTGEAYLNQYLEAKFISDNPIPQMLGFPDIWNWYGQFKAAEGR